MSEGRTCAAEIEAGQQIALAARVDVLTQMIAARPVFPLPASQLANPGPLGLFGFGTFYSASAK
jgi:hypothetical protein